MKAWKIFRKFRGNLYSAYEGWGYSTGYRLRYNLSGKTIDPKPLPTCIGLMVIQTLEGAKIFLGETGRSRGTPKTFILYEVYIDSVRWEEDKHKWCSGYTDSLIIGKEVGVKVIK